MHPLNTEDRHLRLGQLMANYTKIFQEGVGKITGITIRILVKEGSRPVFRRARPVAFAMLPRINAELERLENEGIITKVIHSDYATRIVTVVKKNGSLRICGDFKVTLNLQLVVDEHPIPNIEHL